MIEGGEYVVPVTVHSVVTSEGLLERRKPKEVALALEMLSLGATYKEVKDATGLGMDVVGRLRARHGVALDERRRQLATDAMEIAEGLRLLQKEKIRMLADDPEALAKTNIRDLTLPWAIAQTKIFEALGENKVVVEHRSGAPSIADAVKAIEEAKRSLNKGAVEVDVTPAKETNL
jgi:hypothetical protein